MSEHAGGSRQLSFMNLTPEVPQELQEDLEDWQEEQRTQAQSPTNRDSGSEDWEDVQEPQNSECRSGEGSLSGGEAGGEGAVEL